MSEKNERFATSAAGTTIPLSHSDMIILLEAADFAFLYHPENLAQFLDINAELLLGVKDRLIRVLGDSEHLTNAVEVLRQTCEDAKEETHNG